MICQIHLSLLVAWNHCNYFYCGNKCDIWEANKFWQITSDRISCLFLGNIKKYQATDVVRGRNKSYLAQMAKICSWLVKDIETSFDKDVLKLDQERFSHYITADKCDTFMTKVPVWKIIVPEFIAKNHPQCLLFPVKWWHGENDRTKIQKSQLFSQWKRKENFWQ